MGWLGRGFNHENMRLLCGIWSRSYGETACNCALVPVPNSAKQFVDTSQSALHPKPGRHVDIFEVYSHEGEVFCLFFLTVLNAKSPRGFPQIVQRTRAEVGASREAQLGPIPDLAISTTIPFRYSFIAFNYIDNHCRRGTGCCQPWNRAPRGRTEITESALPAVLPMRGQYGACQCSSCV